jgi:hypothetical protein
MLVDETSDQPYVTLRVAFVGLNVFHARPREPQT